MNSVSLLVIFLSLASQQMRNPTLYPRIPELTYLSFTQQNEWQQPWHMQLDPERLFKSTQEMTPPPTPPREQ